jgi:hypothetical protein
MVISKTIEIGLNLNISKSHDNDHIKYIDFSDYRIMEDY